jgi:hypothetical protein
VGVDVEDARAGETVAVGGPGGSESRVGVKLEEKGTVLVVEVVVRVRLLEEGCVIARALKEGAMSSSVEESKLSAKRGDGRGESGGERGNWNNEKGTEDA